MSTKKKSVGQFLSSLQDYTTAFFTAAFILVVLVSTFCRFFKLATLKWPDELARYLMLWMTFIGCGAAARRGAHFQIEVIYLILPEKLHKAVTILSTLLMDAAMLVIVYLSYSTTMAQMRMGQVSSAMHVPMWIMYLTVPIGCLLNAVQGSYFAYLKCRQTPADTLEEVNE